MNGINITRPISKTSKSIFPRTHEETSALRDLEELAAQFEDKCGEASTWKGNFEKLQMDFGERTSELESLNSQLHKAKQVRL